MHYLFKLNQNLLQEEIFSFLLEKGFKHPYILEEQNSTSIGAFHEEEVEVNGFPLSLLSKEKAEIDWQKEWQLHAPSPSQEGAYPLLLPNNATLYLLPGAGFGDASHATTMLCLKKMAKHLKGQTVLDLGSGSGILSLAAKLMGAPTVIGLEIDPLAIAHSNLNRDYNKIENVYFLHELPILDPTSFLIVINMISSEQNVLFEQIEIRNIPGTWIVSGLLKKEKDSYIIEAKKRGWRFLEVDEEGEWIVLVFERSMQK